MASFTLDFIVKNIGTRFACNVHRNRSRHAMPIQSDCKTVKLARLISPMLEFLRSLAPFEKMNAAHLEFLAKRLRPTFHSGGESIGAAAVEAPGNMHIIKSGRVGFRTKTEACGRTRTADLGPGDIFFTGPAVNRGIREPRALEDTFCLELESDSLEQLMRLSGPFRTFHRRRHTASTIDPQTDE